MKKHMVSIGLAAVCAVVLMATSGVFAAEKGTRPSTPPTQAPNGVVKAKPATPAPEPFTQEKPYSATFFGPWNEGTAKTHTPQITYEKTDTGLRVTVKVDDHPMDPLKPHYIMWIKLEDGDGTPLAETDFVATNTAPVTTFNLTTVPKKIKAFERCNIHGIWMNQVDVTFK
jgi:desulfoferrodoxin-like iron-binding protein